MNIPNITLNNGIKIPVLGLGTWKLKGEECRKAVKKAMELGYRHIDTAEMYGNEQDIGEAIKEFNRKDLFITSKVLPFHLYYNGVLNSCEKSLSKLDTDYLNLYLIHWPGIGSMKSALKAFKKLIEDERIRAFGVSNFSVKTLHKVMPVAKDIGLNISMNQIELSPLKHQEDILEFCKKNKIIVTAYSPLARGKALENEIILMLAEKYNKTPSQISLRWALQKGSVIIPKASSEKHLIENMDLFNFKLSNEDIEKIDNIKI